MRWIFFITLLFITLLLLVPSPAIATPSQAPASGAKDSLGDKEIRFRIGVIGPLTGDVSAWGEDTRNALVLANEKIGGGRFELFFEDGKCLGKVAAIAAQKLISIDKIQFGMVVCTGEMLASAPVFERAKVTVVAPGATAASVSSLGDYIFRTWPSDGVGAQLLAAQIHSSYKHVGIVSEQRGLPQEFAKAFEGEAKNLKLQVSAEDFNSSDGDVRGQLLRLKQAGVDALLINTDSESAALNVLRQVHDLSLKAGLFGNFIAAGASFQSQAGALAEGLVYFDVPLLDLDTVAQDGELLAEFTKRFGAPKSAPYMIAASFSAFRAIRDTALSGADYRSYLYNHTFRGAIGEFRFDKNGDLVGVRPSLKQIRNGKPATLATNGRTH